MATVPETITIQIFGRAYKLRAQKSEEYVQNLAKMVDDKMVAVEQNTNTVDTVRVAVLAALNLADEYCTQKEEYERRIETLERERTRLLEKIEGALTEQVKDTLPDA